jgi:serine/threonine protein kinase/predicted negative regulator of RcsB-dependent stress response
MTPERWRQIEEIFQTIIERPPDERKSLLTQYCDGDAELRHEVESLLDNGADDAFIQGPVKGAAQSLSDEFREDLIGRRLGAYRVIRLVGHGGMGAVYEAARADDQFDQQVAIKIIKRGMDTDFVRERFTSERRILARLEHPHIARLIDGGATEDDLPYFVMEYIEGRPIGEYCEANQLSINERLKLFRQVCAAVQFAHQNLVVHRDIKPSNILASPDGAPKLLDFGIAKLINPDISDDPSRTRTELRMLTPDYASPEQVRGLAITTASDIYSLGAVLYELLTGQRPHRFKSYSMSEIERVVCEAETEKPSAAVARETAAPAKWRKQLAGDLDNIILMAMRKEPERRYQSVEQFSEDIRRYLEGRPVIARKDTISYRGGKFIRRNKLAVAAATLVILSLVGGVAAANYQARRAERRFQQVRKLANTFLFDFHDKIQNLPGSTEARELVVKTALEYLDSLAQEAGGDKSLQLELAAAYVKVGDVQGNPFIPNLGQTAAALASYRKALGMTEKLAARNPSEVQILRPLSMYYYKVGDVEMHSGETGNAIENFRLGLRVAGKVLELQPGRPENYRLLTGGNNRLGDAELKTGAVADALSHYQAGVQIAERWRAEAPSDSASLTFAIGYERVGDALVRRGDLAEAMKSYLQVMKIREDFFNKQPGNTLSRRNLFIIYITLGAVLGDDETINLGDQPQALQYFRKALAIAEEDLAADPKDAQARSDLSVAHDRVAGLLYESDPVRGAEESRQALALTQALLAASPDNFEFRRNQVICHLDLGRALHKLGELDEARRQLQQAVEEGRNISAADPARTQLRVDLVDYHKALADALLDQGASAGAKENYEKAAAMAESLVAATPSDLRLRYKLADTYSSLGHYHATLAARLRTPSSERAVHWQEARDWLQKSLAVWDGWSAHGVSSAFNTTKREQVARAVAQCEANLTKLSATPHR